MKKLISASLMCADLTKLYDSVLSLEKAGIDYLHIDIMDGCFVPNITLGFDLVNAIKKITDIPLDVHMMVKDSSRFIDRMNLGENDIISVHFEADENPQKTLELIRSKGCKAALAINPQTLLSVIEPFVKSIDMLLVMTVNPGFAGQKMFEGAQDKVRNARLTLDEWGLEQVPIQVDGNISPENGRKLSRSGADIFVLGTSALFMKDKSFEQAAADFRAAL